MLKKSCKLTLYSSSVVALIIVIRGISQINIRYNFIPYNKYILYILSIAVLLSLVGYAIVEYKEIKLNKRLILYISLYLIYLTYVYITNGVSGLTYYISYASLPFMYILTKYIKNTTELIRILFYFFFIIYLVQLLFFILDNGLVFLLQREGRGYLGSIFGHTNQAAFFVGLYTIYKVFTAENLTKLVLYALPLSILVFLLGGRVVMFSIIIIISIEILYKNKYLKKRISPIPAYVIFTLVIIALSFESIYSNENTLLSFNSMKWRLTNWSFYLIELDNLYNVLFGFGLGSYHEISNKMYGTFIEVHNDYLRLIYDIGIVGAVLVVYFAIIAPYQQNDNKEYSKLITSFLMFNMMYDNIITNLMVMIVFYIFLNLHVFKIINNKISKINILKKIEKA